MNFTSDLSGHFACPNETVTYSCSVKGTGIIVSASPFFSNAFGGNDLVSTSFVSSNANFTLIETTPLWTAQLQVLQARATNVTCSDPSGTFIAVLPLMLSCMLFNVPVLGILTQNDNFYL